MRVINILFVAAALVCTAAEAKAQVELGFTNRVGSTVTDAGPIAIQNIVSGLQHPWGMTFLPDGRILVTERAGNLRIIKKAGEMSKSVPGVPNVYNEGQGGLLDVALHPNFKENRYVYLSFAMPGPNGSAATALGRGKLIEGRIQGFKTIFRQKPWVEGSNHFGGRIEFTEDNKLFLTMGDRFQGEPAQDLSNTLGTIVRLNLDGSIPESNPYVDDPEAVDAIWSYGHRNIEAAAIHPETGRLWIAEMGPLGGDELNKIGSGKNYGWPVVSWGQHYNGNNIPDPPTHPRFAEPALYWTPVISPSGMIFYTGDVFKAWQGSALIGGLTAEGVVRVAFDGGNVTKEGVIDLSARIRDVVQGPDGFVYVLTDQRDGNIWRLVPLE